MAKSGGNIHRERWPRPAPWILVNTFIGSDGRELVEEKRIIDRTFAPGAFIRKPDGVVVRERLVQYRYEHRFILADPHPLEFPQRYAHQVGRQAYSESEWLWDGEELVYSRI